MPSDLLVNPTHDLQPLKPGPGRSRREVAEDQRARIGKAMVELVGSEGYEAITVRKLASLAHVSTGTFYSLFSGTDQCFLRVHEALVEQARERIVMTRSRHLGRHEQATRALGALIGVLTDDPASGRIVVTEVFAGGPGALGPARAGERLLGAGLKESLDRRGDQIPTTVTTWVTAGIFHWARSSLSTDGEPRAQRSPEDMVRWGARVITSASSSDLESRRALWSRREPAYDAPADSLSENDAELLVAATRRLARTEGYRKLTLSRVSAAAGLTTTAFKRHFASVEEVYLEVVRRLVAWLFGSPTEGHGLAEALQDGLYVDAICQRVARDPGAARMALLDVVEAGRQGLICTAALISRIVATLTFQDENRVEPADSTTEAAVAALWVLLADAVARGQDRHLPITAETFSRLFAAAAPAPVRPDVRS